MFEANPNALTDMQRKYFNLPGNQYHCTLAFLDLDTGTSLSCEKKADQGHTYAQSDQSSIKEQQSGKIPNNLTFRDGKSHFVLNAICK